MERADDYHWDGGFRDGIDTLPAFFDFSGRKTYAEIHTVSWKSASFGCVRPVGTVLSEKCQPVYGKPWDTGVYLHSAGGYTAFVEAADAGVHSGRHNLLYAVSAVCILEPDDTGFIALQHISSWREPQQYAKANETVRTEEGVYERRGGEKKNF